MDPLSLEQLLEDMTTSAQGAAPFHLSSASCPLLSTRPADPFHPSLLAERGVSAEAVPSDLRKEIEGLIREYLERNIE